MDQDYRSFGLQTLSNEYKPYIIEGLYSLLYRPKTCLRTHARYVAFVLLNNLNKLSSLNVLFLFDNLIYKAISQTIIKLTINLPALQEQTSWTKLTVFPNL